MTLGISMLKNIFLIVTIKHIKVAITLVKDIFLLYIKT